jgi:hypothetical protein
MPASRRTFLTGGAAAAAVCLGGGCTRPDRATPARRDGVRNHPLDGVAREDVTISDVRVRLFSADIPLEKWWYGAGVTILTEVFTEQGVLGIGGPSPYDDPVRVQ